MTAKVLQLVRRMPPPPSREEQIMAIVRERLDATINIIDCNAKVWALWLPVNAVDGRLFTCTKESVNSS